ncbi:UDP-glucose 4-epimerase GalE [Sulfuricurvum sp.]|uniref:UDP-glucose 4-epimerase GalE n=1 Tax=Sulfuricurvum sp. TaxID=2025608 RepID=UPI003BAE21C2
MKIFITGGAGYIGTHTCVELLQKGYDLVVYDNFSNSSAEAIRRVESITGKTLTLIIGDIRDEDTMMAAMEGCDAVIHLAGLKAVGESVEKPLDYYDNNVHGTLCLLRAMKINNIKTLVFSSSATVYGNPIELPFTERHPLQPTNPYGQTKLVVEEILRDLYRSDNSWKIIILRYFNPVGAHPSGLIGENPQGIPNNLMPYIAQVAIGRREFLNVFGNDYPTHDGTGVRDYIHIVDLAQGHIKALEALELPQCTPINLGTGQGYSVLDIVKAFSNASRKEVPYIIAPRRPGDIAEFYADPSFAQEFIQWSASKSLEDMCRDTWNFQFKNPDGYRL